MRTASRIVVVVSVLLGVIACASEIGDSCEEEGRVGGECVDGAVCGKAKDSEKLICLKQCVTQVECGADEDCNGVGKTSLKGCRPN